VQIRPLNDVMVGVLFTQDHLDKIATRTKHHRVDLADEQIPAF
jgi:hypothetical protein